MISDTKTKFIAFQKKYAIRGKIVLNNKIIAQVNFKLLSFDINLVLILITT